MWGRRETMKLGFAPFFDLLSAEIQVVIDCHVNWDKGFAFLVIDDVLESYGSVSLLHSDDKLMKDIGFRIADMAEDDTKLLARAVAQDNDEREAA
jgi:hypothetical protein